MASLNAFAPNLRPAPRQSVDEGLSFAIVTPSFWRDLPRCELLVESLDRCAPNIPHYLIIDRRERSKFAHLNRGQHRIIESEALLDSCFWRIPGKSGLWLSHRAPPVRGWIMQQIKKIAVIKAVPEQTLVFCDSDTAFFRPFERANLLVQEKIGLLDINFVNDDIRRWTATAQHLLGLPRSERGYRNHVGYLICWNRNAIKAMQRHIERVNRTPWQLALARSVSFSEYMLYGIFVREILGYEVANHAPSDVPLVKAFWGGASTGESEIADLFSDFHPQTVAIMVHSKDGIEPQRFRHRLEKLWPSRK
jgi:hypothetical protein